MKSIVKWFDDEKGYGFIELNKDKDAFFHYKNINKKGYKTLYQGDIVYFDLKKSKKGYIATNVIEERKLIIR